MHKVVTLLTLVSQLPHDITSRRPCEPNTRFFLNGRLCFCDSNGRWSKSNCRPISRRYSCKPGQIIWQGCNQCICQENGYLLCSNSHCTNDKFKTPLRKGLTFGPNCVPFRSYHINCSICFCPASGQTQDAECVTDISCTSHDFPKKIDITSKSNCIPNVMYLSSCIQCQCSERGYFDPNKCDETCESTLEPPTRKCKPGKMYKDGCNLCQCPANGVYEQRFCIIGACNEQSEGTTISALRTNTKRCVPYSFTPPRCMYCHCNSAGFVNQNVCLEIDCLKFREIISYHTAKDKCYPGEMVPLCTECFCLKDGLTTSKYCSSLCSFQNRLNIIEIVLNDSLLNTHLINRSHIVRIDGPKCIPNSLYIDNGKHCLCPENGDAAFKLCTSFIEEVSTPKRESPSPKIEIDFTSPCEPNTFVEFDCNTCYCTKNGTIDPKWCTYDDCEAKRLVIEAHKIHNPAIVTDKSSCHPGSISKLKCNFCICPESGILKEQACTQNDCTDIDQTLYNDNLTCEPLAYYEVDCNICYCPRDGIKNVAKCTKNPCEKSILRSDSCIPGQLFTDDCNLCVCPPDGNKTGKACTDHICPQVPSLELLKTESLIYNQIPHDQTRNLEICFRGEEFVKGCKLCVCPELGLKMYATCESILCDDNKVSITTDLNTETKSTTQKAHTRCKRHIVEDCYTYNISHSAERKECTPGTLYIVRCKQCICPYLGNINNFCRPLPKNMYCEQAFPYFNYLPMGRRKNKVHHVSDNPDKITISNSSLHLKSNKTVQVRVQHEAKEHTKHKCNGPGTIIDKCFICDCEEGNVVIEEHCFRSDDEECINAKPTFLFQNKVDL